jgi:hypothetical protein
MQILRTDIDRTTAPSGEPVWRVLFSGEGGDRVVVDMAGVTMPGDDKAVLERAKAILVQTATFGLASNDYDASSNGNFDEITVTTGNSSEGGIYIFEYRDGEGSRQVPPSRMPSFEAAREEALRCAIDLLVDLRPGNDDLTGWLVRLRDQSGALLGEIDIEEAQAAEKRRTAS